MIGRSEVVGSFVGTGSHSHKQKQKLPWAMNQDELQDTLRIEMEIWFDGVQGTNHTAGDRTGFGS